KEQRAKSWGLIANMSSSDKFHDECGVVAIFAHPEAEKLAYLGLHALQHRGQESAGIVTSDGLNLKPHKAMGLVADIFTEDVLAKMRGRLAIGHTRYSTAGDSALLNAQPILVQSNKGAMAVAHNGNLTNAADVRQRLERQGSIFQTNSDTEVIVHLIAMSKEHTLPEAIADALRRVEGAFSLVMMSPDRIFAARDPRGFRPLAMGRISALEGQKQDTIVFASETCAFDLIGATYERGVGPPGADQPGRIGASTSAGSPGRGRHRSSRARLGRHCSRGLCCRERHSIPFRADPEPLRGTHLHRTEPKCARFWSEVETKPGAGAARRQTRGAD